MLFKRHSLFLSSSFRPGLPHQAQQIGFKVAVPSTLRKDVCPNVHLSGKSVPADRVVTGGGRLKLSRWDDRWDPSSKQHVLLPTDQQGVVSMFLGLWKPLQNGGRRVPTSFYSAGSLPSPSLHPPLHFQIP